MSISDIISGLLTNTTCYYRIVASNSVGTSYGSEMSFTTSASPNTAPVASAGPGPVCVYRQYGYLGMGVEAPMRMAIC